MRRLLPVLAVLTVAGLAGTACGSSNKTAAKTTATSAAGAQSTEANSSTTAPKFSGSSNSKYCQLAAQVEAKSQPNSTDLKATYAEFDSLAGQFLAVAPSAIKSDANTLVDALKKFEQVLKNANWDITKVNPADVQSLQDPKFQQAADRVSAYDVQVCGIKSESSTTTAP